MTRLLALAAALALCGPAVAQLKSDWETKHAERLLWIEEQARLPPYPERGALLELDVPAANEFRFYIDPGTLSVGQDRVVRYALVARSPSGVENVRVEGLRCSTGEYRIYAVGRPDGSWSVRSGDWRAYERANARGWHHALSRRYFCPNGEAIGSAEEGIRALRHGSHPAVQVERR
jgi:hypothetical protein